jgi:hypothetical protein
LTPGSGKKSRPGSEKNNPDHISDSLETIFWVKNVKYLNSLMLIRDLEWEKFGSGIRDGKNSDPG